MARETKEQREERLRAEAAAEAERKAQYLLTVPKRLMDAQALAQSLGLYTSVSLREDGPEVTVQHHNLDGHYFDYKLGYDAEEWELVDLETRLQDLKFDIESRQERLSRAQSIWEGLDKVDRALVKEFISQLR